MKLTLRNGKVGSKHCKKLFKKVKRLRLKDAYAKRRMQCSTIAMKVYTAAKLDHTAIEDIINKAVHEHLSSVVGGRKSDEDIKLFAKRVSMLVEHSSTSNRCSFSTESDVFDWVRKLATSHYECIEQFAEYLTTIRRFSSNTVRIYILSYGVFMEWFMLRYCNTEHEFSADEYCRIKHVISHLSKCYNVQHKKSLIAADTTIEKLVADLKWPVNGLADLKAALQERIPFAKAVVNATAIINKEIWTDYLQFLIVHWYNKLTVGEGLALLEKCKFINKYRMQCHYI